MIQWHDSTWTRYSVPEGEFVYEWGEHGVRVSFFPNEGYEPKPFYITRRMRFGWWFRNLRCRIQELMRL